MIEASEKVSDGNLKFNIEANINKNNEIYKLILSFNNMIKQLDDQREDLLQQINKLTIEEGLQDQFLLE